jgi:hypothetical protein
MTWGTSLVVCCETSFVVSSALGLAPSSLGERSTESLLPFEVVLVLPAPSPDKRPSCSLMGGSSDDDNMPPPSKTFFVTGRVWGGGGRPPPRRGGRRGRRRRGPTGPRRGRRAPAADTARGRVRARCLRREVWRKIGGAQTSRRERDILYGN